MIDSSVHNTLAFPDLLRLIEERTGAFCAAIASAPDLGAPVPTCPGWTLYDLVQHLSDGRRKWAEIVAAGPADAPPARTQVEAPREDLVAWMTESSRLLVDALKESGPDRACWAWWSDSQAPATAGAAARHQLQEIAVHTYDAQLTIGAAQPLPDEVALDGVDEFQTTCVATTSAWPHEPAIVDYHTTEGRSWRVTLDAGGARVGEVEGTADASLSGTASELVLAFYGRKPVEELKLEGDARVFDRLISWEPA
ncbi:TIGR03083 family protein [Lentzea albidocapillata]|uniref:TIGR03083 family protein n=1 Tax=Lentzea albidocapillata TaxID=40571 RepID=A0A1W2FFF4_9PSEU|nr:TIGR03083 family protein [Lentzea albidocapillata]